MFLHLMSWNIFVGFGSGSQMILLIRCGISSKYCLFLIAHKSGLVFTCYWIFEAGSSDRWKSTFFTGSFLTVAIVYILFTNKMMNNHASKAQAKIIYTSFLSFSIASNLAQLRKKLTIILFFLSNKPRHVLNFFTLNLKWSSICVFKYFAYNKNVWLDS